MSYMRDGLRRGALGLAGFLAVAAPVLAFAPPDSKAPDPKAPDLQASDLQVLAKLERGRWRLRDPAGEPRSICLAAEPTALVQLEHEGVACAREIVSSAKDGVTVQYTCPGRGYGHTSIRVETPRLARIDTQGLVDGRPFSYRAEARKVGAC